MKINSRWILLGASVIVFTLLCHVQFQSSPLKEQVWNPIVFAQGADSASTEFFNYRSSVNRSDVFTVKNFPTQVTEKWRGEKINLGIHGASKASPISDGHNIFIGGDSSWFQAYDFTGKKLWSFYVGDSNRGIHSTASIDDNAVYVGSYRGTIYKLDKRTGKLLWSRIVGLTVGRSEEHTSELQSH